MILSPNFNSFEDNETHNKHTNFSIFRENFTVNLIKSRYSSMYIPSDFFAYKACWSSPFPQNRPLSLAGPAKFHIMDREVDPVVPHTDLVEPPDADFLYSAKVGFFS